MSLGREELHRLYERVIEGLDAGSMICPTEDDMLALALDELEPDEAHRVGLAAEACPVCREELRWLRSSLSWFDREGSGIRANLLGSIGHDTPSLSLADVAGRIRDEIRDAVERLRDGLRKLGASAPAPMLASAGFRSVEFSRIRATLLDREGGELPEGHRDIRLDILRAAVDGEGYLTVELAVPEEGRPGLAGWTWRVHADLVLGGVRLELPPETLGTDDRVAFTGRIPGAEPVARLPAWALRVSVRRQ